MGKPGCAVFGCKPSQSTSRHNFPHPEKRAELFKLWRTAIRNKYLDGLSNMYIYEHYRICSKHFQQDEINVNNALRRTSYPQLFLPGN